MSSKSSPPPDGLSWREGGQGGARKPQEQSTQLKGVFGEGASVLAVPDSTRAGGQEQPDEQLPGEAPTPEQLQRKAQSRGLWDGGAKQAPSQPTQPRAETLPRAVVGTASPSAANSNFRNPSIGNEVSPPLPAALASSQPLAAGSPQQDAATPAEEPRARKPSTRGRDGRDVRSEADPDTMDTMELDMAKFIQKGGLPQKAPAQAAPARAAQNLQAAVAAHAAEKAAAAAAAPAAQPALPAEPPQPTKAARAADATPPAVAAQAALTQPETSKAGTTTEKLATRPTPSSSNTALLVALIVVAAIIALVFIGAALGIWHLPWASTSGHASLSKTVSAKALPEMRTPAMPATQIIPTAVAAPAAPAQDEQAQPAEPAAPSGEAVAAIPADEAAPMHAAASSGGDPEDETDRPTADVTELLTNARTELRAGHIKEAEALLRPALENDPNDHHIAEVLAQTLIARGAAVEAVALAQRIVKKRPKSASYRVLLGDALRHAGDEPGAKAAYREALALDPNLRDAHARLSKL